MSRLTLFGGSLTEAYSFAGFCHANKALLEKFGVRYHGDCDHFNYPQFLSQGMWYSAQPAKRFSQPEFGIEARSMPYAGPFSTFYVNELKDLLASTDQKNIFAFISLRRQDLELENHFALSSKLIPRIAMLSASVHAYVRFYTNPVGTDVLTPDAYITQIETIFGKENTQVFLSSGEKNVFPTPVHRQFLSLLGVSSEALLQEGGSPPSPVEGLPREFLAFEAYSCRLHLETNPVPVLDKWSAHAARFLPGSGYVSNGHSLLGPERRAGLLAFFAKSNELVAKRLGVERLFPDPDPEPDWEPFFGLTPESAFNVAERLDKDFARECLKDFEAVPPRYHDYGQRICLQALHDAVSENSGFPFARPRPEQPKVAVLTLTYNHAAYIEEAMQSVIAQRTDFPIQHIIGDDGSTDGTQEIILEYAQRHPHIVPVFQRENSAGQLNIKTLFEMARAPYVALCDGDDYFTDPDKLQKQADFLDAHADCALCFHPVLVQYEGEPGVHRFYPPVENLPRGMRPFYYLSDLIKCNLIQTNSVMYRWRFAKGLPSWFCAAMCPADWYWHLLHAELGKIGFMNTVMSVYRRHKGAVYYQAESDRVKHRYQTGILELYTYKMINQHFKGNYWEILAGLADGVFADIARYCSKVDDQEFLDQLVSDYPEFADHFFRSLAKLRQINV